jgi:hypothetical protein
MKKFVLSENGVRNLKQNIIKEAYYSDHVESGKKFLDGNFMKAEYENDGKKVGIFIKLDRGLPTKKTMWKQDVLDELDREFYNKITNDTERKGFISQLLDDWYNNKISKYGSLSCYKF